MAEQKLYAVRLKDGTWASLEHGIHVAMQDGLEMFNEFVADMKADFPDEWEGARVVPVRLVEDTDGR